MAQALSINEFRADILLSALSEQGLTAHLYQSGGGTATIDIRNEPQHENLLLGPGSFNWKKPGLSVFTTDDFYYGGDLYDADGNEKPADPESFAVAPGTHVTAIAEMVAREYFKVNPI